MAIQVEADGGCVRRREDDALVPAKMATTFPRIEWTILFQSSKLFQIILIPDSWIAVGYTFRTQKVENI